MVTIRDLFRTQISMMNLFLKELKGFQQIALPQMFEKVLNMPLPQNLKILQYFETSNPSWKRWKRLYVFYIINKITLTTEKKSTGLHNLILLDMSIFSELVIENDSVKKALSFFALMEVVQPAHDQVLVLEDRSFHSKVLRRHYRNSKFNIIANFNLYLSTSSLFKDLVNTAL